MNSQLAIEYATKFLGYGNWRAKVWFIGIEEAGGKTEQEIEERLLIWEKRGKRELENIQEFYEALHKTLEPV